MTQCVNCGCHENESTSVRLSRRAQRVMRSKEFRELWIIDAIPEKLRNRTTRDREFGFGLGDFIPSYENGSLIARFHAAIHQTEELKPQNVRFYAQQLLMPQQLMNCRPYEYQKGNAHFIDPGAPISPYDLSFLDGLDDTQWARWLASQWNVFAAFVIRVEL